MADKSNTDFPAEIEPDLIEMVEWHTRMRVATRLLMDLYPPMMHTSYRSRYRVKRPDRFQAFGRRLSDLTIEMTRLQDEIGELVNKMGDAIYESENEGT